VALIGSIAITTYRHHLAHLAGVPLAALHAAQPSLYAATATAVHLPGGVHGPFFTAAANGFGQGLHAALLIGAAISVLGAAAVARMRPLGPPSPPGGLPDISPRDSENMP
jgi:hypothetical protein